VRIVRGKRRTLKILPHFLHDLASVRIVRMARDSKRPRYHHCMYSTILIPVQLMKSSLKLDAAVRSETLVPTCLVVLRRLPSMFSVLCVPGSNIVYRHEAISLD
jgi:hypothetical protein